MATVSVLDAAGRRRSSATMPGYHAGRPPRNKGIRYPADPPTVDEIVAIMRHSADNRHGWRLLAMIIVLWRAGLRIQEALALAEHDLDHRRGSILVRHGKGGRRREVGMDEWGWEQLRPWLAARVELPAGPLLCVIDGPTHGRPWSAAAVRTEFRRTAAQAGVRRRFAPHQLRHAHALELARESLDLAQVLARCFIGRASATRSPLPRTDHAGLEASAKPGVPRQTECLDLAADRRPAPTRPRPARLVDHYNTERPHYALGRCPPVATQPGRG